MINDLPDVDQQVIVLWQSPPNIPNLNFSTIPSLPDPIRAKLVSVLVDIIKTDQGKALLSQANGAYDVQDLRVVDDSAVRTVKAGCSPLRHLDQRFSRSLIKPRLAAW